MAIDGMYKPTEQELELLKRWYAPDVSKKIDQTRTNALGMNRAKLAQASIVNDVAVEEVNESPAPLSAQDLAEISAQAQQQGFEEGLVKGKEQGIANGYEEGYSQGIEQGVEEGKKQGLELAQPEIDQKIEMLDLLIAQLQEPIAQQQELVEQSLVNLTVTLAKKVVHTEIEQNTQPIVSAISQGLNLLGSDKAITIKLNPSDIDAAENIWPKEAQQTRQLSFISDPSLSQGDCFLESRASSVFFDIQSRCDQVFDDFVSQESPRSQPQDLALNPQQDLSLPEADSAAEDSASLPTQDSE